MFKNTLIEFILYILGILTGLGIVLLFKECFCAILLYLVFK